MSALPGAWQRFDVYDHNDACSVLADKDKEFRDVSAMLDEFRFSKSDVIRGGGGKTNIAENLEGILRKRGWLERGFKDVPVGNSFRFDTHKIDCVHRTVALEIEWNNKDTFFDRDLNAFRILFTAGIIDCGIIVTRSTTLQKVFKGWVKTDGLSKDKFVSTTTHFDRLVPRIASNAAGQCPVLAIGITDAAMQSGYNDSEYFSFNAASI